MHVHTYTHTILSPNVISPLSSYIDHVVIWQAMALPILKCIPILEAMSLRKIDTEGQKPFFQRAGLAE